MSHLNLVPPMACSQVRQDKTYARLMVRYSKLRRKPREVSEHMQDLDDAKEDHHTLPSRRILASQGAR